MSVTIQEKIQDRDNQISFVRQILVEPYFVFDTETTGKDRNYDQIVQMAVLKSTGKQFKSLVKPTIPVSEGAFDIHHISDKDLENAPVISEVLGEIPVRDIYMFTYNIAFDSGVLKNSLRASGSGFEIDIDSVNIPCDAMRIYAAFKGDWSEKYNSYRWYSLEDACEQCGIEIDLPLHDAMSDAILTERLMKYVANQKLSTEQ
jgi:DNA polymerase-3 subunit epsilon